MFPKMHELIPEGRRGSVEISYFEVSEKESDLTLLRATINSRPSDFVAPGKYVSLHVGNVLMMSDVQMERQSNEEVVRKAKGRVFIAGLGLGMILHPIAAKPEVESVTVLEKESDVIELIRPTLPKKVQVVEGDIFSWRPGRGSKFDTIYFDIWPHISDDNLEQMQTLHRRYRSRLNKDGWMNSWMFETIRKRARAAKRRDPFYGMVRCGFGKSA